MLRVGELTGRTDEAFLNMYEYLDRDKVTIDRIKAAMRYPSFVIFAIVIAVGVLTVMVIPAFAKVFAGAQLDLPWPTKLILALSDRSEEHTSELPSLMRTSYAVFCLKKN